jgi:hypothetical protein
MVRRDYCSICGSLSCTWLDGKNLLKVASFNSQVINNFPFLRAKRVVQDGTPIFARERINDPISHHCGFADELVAVAEMAGEISGNNGCQRVWRILKRRLDLGRRFGWRALPVLFCYE